MKKITFTYLLIFVFGMLSFAQNKRVLISGTVVEGGSQQPLEFATVKVVNSENDQLITGTSTDLEGKFKLETDAPEFYLEVGFIGFVNTKITEFEVRNGKVNLGNIAVLEDTEQLEEVVVRAEKSQTEFKLDKRVFNVGQDLSSTGASALEVLNNVPSVNVNIEGQISLRGSNGVQILINGKPSVMASEGGTALGTITADMIEKVEVITNPSAKYDAAGTTGIINIVLKKEEKEGLNGSLTVNTGVPHNHNVGLSLNKRTEKFNLFSQLGVGYRELPRFEENINQDLRTNTTIESDGVEYRNENFYNLILGTDYYINDLNVLTLSGYFAYEIEDQPSSFDFARTDASGMVTDRWSRSEVTEATNPKWQYEFQYKKDFEDSEDHTFLFTALGNFFGKDQSSDFKNTNLQGDFAQGDQQTRTNFMEAGYTFKADYTKPFSEKITMETGAQYIIQDVSNDFAVSDFSDGEWVLNTDFTNIFEYNQKVLGAYVTGAYEDERWGLKLGARVENTDLETFLVNTEERNDQNFTNLFPSLHTSYKVNQRFSMQAGYSRRIQRPSLWTLNPFFNIRNNFSIRQGNPNLLPEFTDSYEIMGIYILDAASFNFGVYHRYTTDVVERIAFFEDNVSINKPLNIGTNRATGIEFNAKYTPVRWLTFNGDFNYNTFDRQGEFEDENGLQLIDFSADQWSSRLTSKLKLPAGFDLEIMGNYRSDVETVQGRRSGFLSADLGLRKKILKGKGVFNLSVRDVFASRISENETFQDDFYLYSYGLRGRFVIVGFSYGFGKGEAMQYGGGRRRF
ncbi:MAG: outer membrane beta-barrel family protein [Bacteroidota bacterium]